VASRERPLRRPVQVPYGPVLLTLTPSATADIVSSVKRRSGPHNARRRLVEQLLWRHLHARLAEARARAGRSDREGPGDADQWVSPLGPDDSGDADLDTGPLPVQEITPAELGTDLRHLPVVAEALDRMWPVLSPQELLHDLFGAPPLVELAGRGVLSEAEQRLLLRPRAESTEAVRWSEADLALLDEARALLGTPRRRPGGDRARDQDTAVDEDGVRAYGHIVVDEAQDLSPMQWRMLGRRSLSSSMTIVGDIAQATGSWAPASWTEALQHLPTKRGSKVVELTVNYRTPSEVMDLASRVLQAAAPDMVAPQSVRTTGVRPRILASDARSWAATVAQVVAEESAEVAGEAASGSVGVICPPSMVAEAAAALDAVGLEFGSLEAGALDDTVTLVTPAAVKGLEFDSVIVVEPARVVAESAQGLRALYVALTRATRRLSIVHSEPLPDSLTSTTAGGAGSGP
jgi:DNA helicase IV